LCILIFEINHYLHLGSLNTSGAVSMKLDLHRSIIYRTPRFPLNATLVDNWETLKQAISESSEDFYAIIKDLSYAELEHQPKSIQYTIWKYFNRAKHRSTPFGSFAAIGIGEGTYSKDNYPLLVSEDLIKHSFTDWPQKNNLEYTFEELIKIDGSLFTNSTYYACGESIRYITFQEDKFEIAEIEADEFVFHVLDLCRKPTPIIQVIAALHEQYTNMDEIEEHLTSLISLQLLLTSLDANIMGVDYFTRIGKTEKFKSNIQYIISERKVISGKFDLRSLKPLEKVIQLLHQYVPPNENIELRDFVQQFNKRFDRQAVPLMVALDPELGVGYQNMESSSGLDEIIGRLAANKMPQDENVNRIKDSLSELLFGSIKSDQHCLQIEDILHNITTRNIKPLPNTFNSLFTIVEDQIWIELVGGKTATALAGRFSLGIDAIHDFTKEIATYESEANPDVVFFDLAYMAETHLDNVNRRKHIYDYQLTLLNYDTSKEPLTADDILISLNGNQLILWSKKLGKRLIPRLSTAYNHIRSDLPVFRLLCDLQQEGIQTNLTFRIEQLFPELRHYPRIQYRNVIISPEKWWLNKHDLKKESIQSYLSRLEIRRYFRCGVTDQTLYFDRENQNDMEAFSHYLGRMSNLLIEETPISQNSMIKDFQGNPYAVQLMATWMHKETIYHKIAEQLLQENVARMYLPGEEWFYTEIYCHPTRTDELLRGSLKNILQTHNSLIRQWFFIRYDEGNGPHIRLRIHLIDNEDLQLLVKGLTEGLKYPLESGLVSDLQIKIYRRELERYGPDLINYVEHHFQLDSQEVMTIICTDISIDERYLWCIHILEALQNRMIIGLESKTFFADTILKSLQHEHRLSSKDFAEMNKKYKYFQSKIGSIELDVNPQKLINSFAHVLSHCSKYRRNSLFMDLFHMHINRLFSSHQRTHELIIYYFLERRIKRSAFHSLSSS
jgi:thiopeptide-type bacteriocin biosynthesis protein